MPCKFVVETKPPIIMTGVWVEIDTETGKAIQRKMMLKTIIKISRKTEKSKKKLFFWKIV